MALELLVVVTVKAVLAVPGPTTMPFPLDLVLVSAAVVPKVSDGVDRVSVPFEKMEAEPARAIAPAASCEVRATLVALRLPVPARVNVPVAL